MRKALFSAVIVIFFVFSAFVFSKTAVAYVTNECLELSVANLQRDLDIIKTAIAKNEKVLEFLGDKEGFISLVKRTGKKWDEECEKKYSMRIEAIEKNNIDLTAQAGVFQRALNDLCDEILKRQLHGL